VLIQTTRRVTLNDTPCDGILSTFWGQHVGQIANLSHIPHDP
jgi:hypothetical protein